MKKKARFTAHDRTESRAINRSLLFQEVQVKMQMVKNDLAYIWLFLF